MKGRINYLAQNTPKPASSCRPLRCTFGLTNGGREKMQFGRIYGVSLIVLGILLCVLQFVRYAAQPKNEVNPSQAVRKEEHLSSSLPGIIGAGSLAAGIALFVTARRKDEPNPKYKVK